MEEKADFFINFMENNPNEVIDFCNTIKLNNIENETDELSERVIKILENNPQKMAKTIVLLLFILSNEKIEENENLSVDDCEKFKKYLELVENV